MFHLGRYLFPPQIVSRRKKPKVGDDRFKRMSHATKEKLVDILSETTFRNNGKRVDRNIIRHSVEKWGDGHWDFPFECKHKTLNDGVKCTCGHPHKYE
jgi:hypothetical protein